MPGRGFCSRLRSTRPACSLGIAAVYPERSIALSSLRFRTQEHSRTCLPLSVSIKSCPEPPHLSHSRGMSCPKYRRASASQQSFPFPPLMKPAIVLACMQPPASGRGGNPARKWTATVLFEVSQSRQGTGQVRGQVWSAPSEHDHQREVSRNSKVQSSSGGG